MQFYIHVTPFDINDSNSQISTATSVFHKIVVEGEDFSTYLSFLTRLKYEELQDNPNIGVFSFQQNSSFALDTKIAHLQNPSDINFDSDLAGKIFNNFKIGSLLSSRIIFPAELKYIDYVTERIDIRVKRYSNCYVYSFKRTLFPFHRYGRYDTEYHTDIFIIDTRTKTNCCINVICKPDNYK